MSIELTSHELIILDLTADLWNMIAALPDKHPSDMEETQKDIHSIQHRIMARVAYRSNPAYFTLRN